MSPVIEKKKKDLKNDLKPQRNLIDALYTEIILYWFN